ncbi:MAG: ribonuclease HII [Dehalococcoidia bacterium]|nr:ribonuclease HII [Dehalococcoidia bacterium]
MRQPLRLSRAVEAAFWSAGLTRVAGVDEVGRGPIAGPVVAGAVLVRPDDAFDWDDGVRDSKQLTRAARERLAEAIRRRLPTGVGMVDVEEIDALGIGPAVRLAMRRALDALPERPDALVIDAITLPTTPLPQRSIVRGDATVWSVAAASIVAKVARDRHMRALATRYPVYRFDQHMGYGTPAHLAALAEFGPCPAHRRSFAPLRRQLLASL